MTGILEDPDNINRDNDPQTSARRLLSTISGALGNFIDEQDESNREFHKAISQKGVSRMFDPEKDIIYLYGFSKTVMYVLTEAIQNVGERRRLEIILIKTDRRATTPSEESVMRDELLERGFSNLTLYSFQDVLTIGQFHKRLNFLFGFEVINSKIKKAIFHFGAGQILQTLINRLEQNSNDVRVYLIGAKYKDVTFQIEDEEIAHSSIFEFDKVKNYEWLNEDVHWQNSNARCAS